MANLRPTRTCRCGGGRPHRSRRRTDRLGVSDADGRKPGCARAIRRPYVRAAAPDRRRDQLHRRLLPAHAPEDPTARRRQGRTSLYVEPRRATDGGTDRLPRRPRARVVASFGAARPRPPARRRLRPPCVRLDDGDGARGNDLPRRRHHLRDRSRGHGDGRDRARSRDHELLGRARDARALWDHDPAVHVRACNVLVDRRSGGVSGRSALRREPVRRKHPFSSVPAEPVLTVLGRCGATVVPLSIPCCTGRSNLTARSRHAGIKSIGLICRPRKNLDERGRDLAPAVTPLVTNPRAESRTLSVVKPKTAVQRKPRQTLNRR
jgi:hypothetical protein